MRSPPPSPLSEVLGMRYISTASPAALLPESSVGLICCRRDRKGSNRSDEAEQRSLFRPPYAGLSRDSSRSSHRRLYSARQPACRHGWSARFRLWVQRWRESLARAWQRLRAAPAKAARGIPGVSALLRWSRRRLRRQAASSSAGSMRRTGSELFDSQAGGAARPSHWPSLANS